MRLHCRVNMRQFPAIHCMAFTTSISSNRSSENIAAPADLKSPSLTEVLSLALTSYFVFLTVLTLIGGSYHLLVSNNFGDNPAYIEAAGAIRHWNFTGVVVKQFWGLPYAMAAISLITGASMTTSLIVVCGLAALASTALCYWLWDGWIAAFFALLSLDWLQRSLLGGAEPLFVALLLASFIALRTDRWRFASLLAALATIVRPFGIFALIGLAIHLLYRKRIADCAIATTIALAVGALYAWPLQHYFGSPFTNVALYQRNDWHGGLPFSFPFVAIIHNTFPVNAPLTNLLLTWGWILFVLLGFLVALRTGIFKDYLRDHTAEACFFAIYALALYTYNAPEWSRSNFPRFALPLLPWTLVFLRTYLPKRRSVLWALAVITPALSAASAVGIRETAALLLRHLR